MASRRLRTDEPSAAAIRAPRPASGRGRRTPDRVPSGDQPMYSSPIARAFSTGIVVGGPIVEARDLDAIRAVDAIRDAGPVGRHRQRRDVGGRQLERPPGGRSRRARTCTSDVPSTATIRPFDGEPRPGWPAPGGPRRARRRRSPTSRRPSVRTIRTGVGSGHPAAHRGGGHRQQPFEARPPGSLAGCRGLHEGLGEVVGHAVCRVLAEPAREGRSEPVVGRHAVRPSASSRDARASASSAARSWPSARCRRDFAVPSGMPRLSATAGSGRSR